MRVDLEVAYRLIDLYGWSDLLADDLEENHGTEPADQFEQGPLKKIEIKLINKLGF